MSRTGALFCLVTLCLSSTIYADATARLHPWWDLDPAQADREFEIGRANQRRLAAGTTSSPQEGSITLTLFEPGLLDLYDVVKPASISLRAPRYVLRAAGAYYERASTDAARINATIAHGYQYPNLAGDPGTTVREILAAEKDRIRFSVELHSSAGSYEMRGFRFIMETAEGDRIPMKAAPLEISLEKRGPYVWVARYSPEFPLRTSDGQPYLTNSTRWVRLQIIPPSGKRVPIIWTLSDPPSVAVEGDKPATPSIW